MSQTDKRKILLFAQDEPFYDTVATFLKRRGWTAFATSQVDEAVRWIFSTRPDYIVVSLNHFNPNIFILPKLFKAIFDIDSVPCNEADQSALAIAKMQRTGMTNIHYGPVSGPALFFKLKSLKKPMMGGPGMDAPKFSVSLNGQPVSPKTHSSQEVTLFIEEVLAQRKVDLNKIDLQVDYVSNESPGNEHNRAADAPPKRVRSGQPEQPTTFDEELLEVFIRQHEDRKREIIESLLKETTLIERKDPVTFSGPTLFRIRTGIYKGFYFSYLNVNSLNNAMLKVLVRRRMFDYLKHQGHSVNEQDFLKHKIEEIEMPGWAFRFGKVLELHREPGDEINVSHLTMEDILKIEEVKPQKELTEVEMSTLTPGTKLDFDLYLNLHENNKKICYARKGAILTQERIDRIVQSKNKLHVRTTSLIDYKNYCLKNIILSKLIRYKAKMAA